MSENIDPTPDITPTSPEAENLPGSPMEGEAPLSAEEGAATPEVTEAEPVVTPEDSPQQADVAEAPAAAVLEAPTRVSRLEENRKKKRLLYLAAALVAILALVGTLFATGTFKNLGEPDPATPIAKGKFIIVPDNIDGGKPNSEKKIGEAVDDKTAPKYSDPASLADYRIVNDDGSVLLKSPLDGPCALNAMGNVLPPSNYMHSCYFEKNGAVIYTSHAVIGTRTGALENIQYLKIGQIVTLDGVEYKVTKVATYNAKNLPEYLLKKGTVALLTCHIDNSTKSFEDFTKTDVAFLEKK